MEVYMRNKNIYQISFYDSSKEVIYNAHFRIHSLMNSLDYLFRKIEDPEPNNLEELIENSRLFWEAEHSIKMLSVLKRYLRKKLEKVK